MCIRDSYQAWRSEIVDVCRKQVLELNPELIAVKLKLQYVEKYKKRESFLSLGEGDKGCLLYTSRCV